MITKGRKIRKNRIKDKVRGTADYPRLVVFRSNRFISAQLIDDQSGTVLANVSEKNLPEAKGVKVERAAQVGKQIALLAEKQKISKARLDRAGYRYHGRIKALADGAREGGLKI